MTAVLEDRTRTIRFEAIDAFDDVERALAKAPGTAYYWIREAYVRIAIDHRTTFLRRSAVRLNKKPSASNKQPIQAPKVNEAPGDLDLERAARWDVTPTAKRLEQPQVGDLDNIRFEGISESEILQAWEKGGSIVPKNKKVLAVPITPPGAKSRGRRSPAEFRKRNPNARLIARKSKATGTLLLFELKRKRKGKRERLLRNKKGEPRKSQRKTIVDVLIPRWALIPRVDLRRALGFYSSWDSLDERRKERLRFAARRILKDIANGIRD